MNKYLVSICDIQGGTTWIQSIPAKSNTDCQEKLVRLLIEKYDELEDCTSYREFVKQADKNDILIGDIKDIEEL